MHHCQIKKSSLRVKRSNPGSVAKSSWIAQPAASAAWLSFHFLAMTLTLASAKIRGVRMKIAKDAIKMTMARASAPMRLSLRFTIR